MEFGASSIDVPVSAVICPVDFDFTEEFGKLRNTTVGRASAPWFYVHYNNIDGAFPEDVLRIRD